VEESLPLNYAQALRRDAAFQRRYAIRRRRCTAKAYLFQVVNQSQIGDKIIIVQGCEVACLLRVLELYPHNTQDPSRGLIIL
jgi:hypothetical protein